MEKNKQYIFFPLLFMENILDFSHVSVTFHFLN